MGRDVLGFETSGPLRIATVDRASAKVVGEVLSHDPEVRAVSPSQIAWIEGVKQGKGPSIQVASRSTGIITNSTTLVTGISLAEQILFSGDKLFFQADVGFGSAL